MSEQCTIDGIHLRPRERSKLSEALYRIHRKGRYFTGLTDVGRAHLAAGGHIGGEDGMPMEVGMRVFTCCVSCQHRSRPARDEWPCETVALVLEAGIVIPIEAFVGDFVEKEPLGISVAAAEGTVNITPDKQTEVRPW